ncbi:pentatricopeptide repeat-containing protein At4g02820, mitochondrial-like [Carica papaya]|uniref:pentatricopeptide repeat-containing protein At4g02820, mitochondrial-like n=1 Tax=Carica papaya TaxID=3649 RepID=UPI000B8C9071|nr:pentatricopeptide repeat-containing protein At4g02820, mitochondrial-like [Carica papaya]
MLLRSVKTTVMSAARFFTTATAADAVGESVLKGGGVNDGLRSGTKGRDTLGRRLLSLVFPKRSAVIAIRKWKEEGHTVRKYELNRIVRELRKLKRYKHALEEYILLSTLYGSSSVPHIPSPGLSSSSFLQKTMIVDLKPDQMEMAENFYHRIVQKGIIPCYTTWEILTWGYLKNEQAEKVMDCFKKAVGSVKKWDPNVKLIREVFNKLEDQGNYKEAEKLLVILRKAGHVSIEVYNSLLRTYAKAGKMPLVVTERMKKDNVHLDEETHKLIKLTSKMCVSEVCCTP